MYNNSTDLKPFRIDCSDTSRSCADISGTGNILQGRSYITNAARLRIKECDRLAAMAYNLNEIGGRITELSDGLVIDGVDSLDGGTIDGFNDHRSLCDGDRFDKMRKSSYHNRSGMRIKVLS